MTIMKQSIAGKDNEHFLGDETTEKRPLLQASIELPAKPGTPTGKGVSAITAPAKPKASGALYPTLPSSISRMGVSTSLDATKAHLVSNPAKSGSAAPQRPPMTAPHSNAASQAIASPAIKPAPPALSPGVKPNAGVKPVTPRPTA
jgi:hypothetical protein